MRVLIACEFSGVVRDAFAARGHDAWSIDLLPSERPGQHIVGDAVEHLADGWDLMIAHPPCTDLAVSGARHFARKEREQAEALAFFRRMLDAPIPQIAVENPVSVAATRIWKPTQIIQPYWFGDPEQKTTCLWLINLWPLMPTNMVKPAPALAPDGSPRVMKTGKHAGKTMTPIHYGGGSRSERWKIRSRTYQGIADAMADQWGNV